MPAPKLPKLLLASALTFAIYSTLHATNISQTGTAGTPGNNGIFDGDPGTNGTPGGDVTISLIDSQPSDGGTVRGGNGGKGGNGGATASKPQAGNAGAGASGGNATVSLDETPTTNNVSNLSISGGNGGAAGIPGPALFGATSGNPAAAGDGGSGTLLTSSFITLNASSIFLSVAAIGGNGGNQSAPNSLAGNGGVATLQSIALSSPSGNITALALQVSGDGGTGPTPAFNGISQDSSLNNILSASTTGNITLNQIAKGGNGSSGGNASSSLTISNTAAASLTATANATAGSHGTGTALINLTGKNVNATASAFSGTGIANATAIINSSTPSIATATTRSLGNASATAFGSNLFFPSYRTYAYGNAIPGTQSVAASSSTQANPLGNASTFSRLFLIPSTINDNGPKPINDQLLHLELSAQNSSVDGIQTNTVGFDGMLDTTLFKTEDIVFSGDEFTPFPVFNSFRFRIWINNLSVIDRTFPTALAFNTYFENPSGQLNSYDLGPMASFGPGPLEFQVQMDLTTQFTGQNASLELIVNNEDPTLLTPEPASLSLLTAATLPLLLKRRRKN